MESSRIASCGTDVEDVLVDELEISVDKPGITIGTSFSFAASDVSAISGKMWFLTTGQLV